MPSGMDLFTLSVLFIIHLYVYTAAKRQTAVTAYFSSEQLLLFAFLLQNACRPTTSTQHFLTTIRFAGGADDNLISVIQLQNPLLSGTSRSSTVCPSVGWSVGPSVGRSVRVPVCLSVGRLVGLSLFFPSVWLFLCQLECFYILVSCIRLSVS